MKEYINLRNKIMSRVREEKMSCQTKGGVLIDIFVEDDLLLIDVKKDTRGDIKSVSFGKVNNTYMTNKKEINTVVLKDNREYIEESVIVLKKIVEIVEDFDKIK